ncbi:MAG: nuclear transport factor 2 family protein [Actinomycetota bacterium]
MSPRDVALAYLSALGGDEPAAVLDLVSDDFVNEQAAFIAPGCVGKPTYAEKLPQFFADFADRSYEVLEVVDGTSGSDGSSDAGTVAVQYHYRATVDGAHGATRIDVPGVMLIRVDGGVVTSRVDTWDSLHFFDQTGLAPPDTTD